MYLYFAEGLVEGEQNPDEDEFVNVISIPFEDALAAIGSEKICDSKTIMALLWYQKHINENPTA
jgi:ADP-ribose pyrophosphatase